MARLLKGHTVYSRGHTGTAVHDNNPTAALAPLGERVAIPQSRESRVRGFSRIFLKRRRGAVVWRDPVSTRMLYTAYRGWHTRKTALLISMPLGVLTHTLPVVAPAGTVVVISEGETTAKVAGVPLKVTLVAPVRSVPRILTAALTMAEVRCVSTERDLQTVPQPSVSEQLLLAPPSDVVP